jgi:Protein of unknown function (DUF2510)
VDQQTGVLIVGILLVAWIILGMRSTLRSRRTATSLATTAQARGWTYEEQSQAQIDVGEIFGESNRGAYGHVVTGTAATTPFVAFDYGSPQQNGVHGFVLAKLPKFLPVLEVRPAGSVQRAVRGMEYGLPLVRFESADFNARFSVQASNAKFASDLMTPQLMEALMAAPPLTWRIMDACLVSWSDSPLTATQIVSTVPTLRLIHDAIPAFVWDSYASAQPVPFSIEPELTGPAANPQPAPTPFGWYADPTDATMMRWWNGSAWTSNLAKVRVR